LCIAALLLLRCTVAEAQDTRHRFFGVAVAGEERDPGNSFGPPGTTNSELVPAITAFIGVWAKPWLGIEASADLAAAQSFAWHYSYSDATTENRASHRDWMFVGSARVRPHCGRLCVEPLAGLGVTFHHAESIVTESCGAPAFPKPCAAVPESQGPNDIANRLKLTLLFGLDAIVKISPRVSVGPALRFYYVSHDTWLFPYPDGPDFRGPLGGGNWIPSVGVTATFN
jgi:hypothetical protein